MGALGDPNASQQEGSAAAIVAVLRRAAAADVGASLPVLLPRLLRSLSPSLLAQTAVLVALEATLDAAAPSLLGAHASAIRAAAAKALESKDFKVRGAAAKMVLPLLRAADASAAGNDGVDGEDGVSVENLRAKLEAVRYDRFEQVRKAAGAAIALLPPPPPADAAAPTPARPSTAKKARASGRPSLLSSTMPAYAVADAAAEGADGSVRPVAQAGLARPRARAGASHAPAAGGGAVAVAALSRRRRRAPPPPPPARLARPRRRRRRQRCASTRRTRRPPPPPPPPRRATAHCTCVLSCPSPRRTSSR